MKKLLLTAAAAVAMFSCSTKTQTNPLEEKVNSYAADKLAGSKTFSSSSSGKTIYFKVRAYSKVNGQTIFSEWSAVKSIKIK